MTERMFAAGAALVIGASGGVGGAVAEALAREGADLHLTYRNGLDAVEAVAARVRERGARAELHRLDLEDADGVAKIIDEVEAAAGSLHTVIYAAGPQLPLKYLSSIGPVEMERFLLGDTLAFFRVMHAALPALRRSRGSAVAIHTTGLYRWPLKDGLSVVPKAGIESMIKGFAREEGRSGVRLNGVALGVMDGGLFEKMRVAGDIDQKFIDAAMANVPLQRLGRLEDAAEAACFLASSRAAFITGHTLVVDGGYHL